jgi:hypothetical protein
MRQIVRDEIINPRVFSGIIHADDIELPSFGSSLTYEGDSEEPDSRPKRPDAKMVKELDQRTGEILTEIQPGTTRVERGRRESQYSELVKREEKRNMQVAEFIDSDIPIYVSGLESKNFEEIAKSGKCIGFSYIQGTHDSYERFNLLCRSCGYTVNPRHAFILKGSLYCALHLPSIESCAVCTEQRPDCKAIKTYDERDVFVCLPCIEAREQCENCDNPIDLEYIEIGRCEDCLESDDDSSEPFRSFSYSMRWTGKEKGEIVKSERLYSSEIEGFVRDSASLYKFYELLPKECGISNDGSLSDSLGRGFETQTPRLQGKKGEELMYRVASILKQENAYTNKTCGMHIHLDGKGIVTASRREYPTALLQLWKAHLVFEDVIMSFIPYKRRRNDYCRPMGGSFKLMEIEGCESLLDAEKLWYKQRRYTDIQRSKREHYHSSRYFAVNFHSLLSHGHLEIRHHSATMNPRKVLEWANLHALIMDAAAKKQLTYDFLSDAQVTSVMREKTEMLFDKIGLAESSRQYFRARQKKFGKKEVEELEEENNAN